VGVWARVGAAARATVALAVERERVLRPCEGVSVAK